MAVKPNWQAQMRSWLSKAMAVLFLLGLVLPVGTNIPPQLVGEQTISGRYQEKSPSANAVYDWQTDHWHLTSDRRFVYERCRSARANKNTVGELICRQWK
jgi:hypothetical protein